MTQIKQKKIYFWIFDIISSCREDVHFEGVDRLISLYAEKEVAPELISKLKDHRAFMTNAIAERDEIFKN